METGGRFQARIGSRVEDTIQTIFTLEDIEITETLYCLWITN